MANACPSASKGCFGCGKPGHLIRDCPHKDPKAPVRAAQTSATTSRRQNRLYAVGTRQEQEQSADVVTGILPIFGIDCYVLLDPGASLSFVSPYIASRFSVTPTLLDDSFYVTTPTGESVVVFRVYHDCPVSVASHIFPADLIELCMVDFDVILGMD